RPAPGTVRLSIASADEPELTTVDGWKLTVDRLLTGVGNAGFTLPCDVYSDARYDRLLDVRRPGEQKISQIFGLGQCFFWFGLGWPSPEALLGDGVTPADLERMALIPIEGPRSPTPPPVRGSPLELYATATKGAVVKRLHWALRNGWPFRDCGFGNESQTTAVDLKSNDDYALRVRARGAVVFQDGTDPGSAARFDPIALADDVYGDGDGDITVDELKGVKLTVARGYGPYAWSPGNEDPTKTDPTLNDYVNLELLRHLVRFADGLSCRAVLGPGTRTP
ncbi:MAG: hypothetical protein ABW133_09340, partial [Polyangiaceae bacterium]